MSKLMTECVNVELEAGGHGLVWTATERGAFYPAAQVCTTAQLTHREMRRIKASRQAADTTLRLQNAISGQEFSLSVPAGASASKAVKQAIELALEGRKNPAVLPANA